VVVRAAACSGRIRRQCADWAADCVWRRAAA
jgi:hypothetical protein